MLASSPVLCDRICSVRRHIQRDRHGRAHQALKSQLSLLFKLVSQDPDPCPRRPEGHVSPSRSHWIVNDRSVFFPDEYLCELRLKVKPFLCSQLFKWQHSQGPEEGHRSEQYFLQCPKPRAHRPGQYSTLQNSFGLLVLLKLPLIMSCPVNERSHSKARDTAERHALPQHPHQANANVPQRRSFQALGGERES